LVVGRWSAAREEMEGVAGAKFAQIPSMIAKNLEELQVHQQALEAADAISALLDRPALQRYPELRKQIADCSGRIPALISEGFG
jgi:hypothetical protein